MIIPMNSAFRPKVNQIIAEEWAGPIVVTKGKAHILLKCRIYTGNICIK